MHHNLPRMRQRAQRSRDLHRSVKHRLHPEQSQRPRPILALIGLLTRNNLLRQSAPPLQNTLQLLMYSKSR
jgi:hypothetical protein